MLLYIFDLIGVAVFAVSGVLAAGRKSLDLLGVIIIAMLTAVGGGTIRDVLLDRHPIFWIADQTYALVIILATLITIGYVRWRPPPEQALGIADALGLALFAIMGAHIAEEAQLAPLIVILMGTMTGVAGGMLRDIFTAEIPLILRHEIYATAAIAGIVVYLVLRQWGMDKTLASGIGMTLIASFRIAAMLKHWRLPTFHLKH